MSWRGSIAGLVVALLSATAGAATFDVGRTAYMQGEYARAFEILKPLADKGDANAAYILGREYQLGQGVKRDLGEAWYWYRRAEAKGHVEASLFRHLLVTKWKIDAADRARGEAKYAAFKAAGRTVAARVFTRPSPKPTPAVAPPATAPDPVTVSKLPAPKPAPPTKAATRPDRRNPAVTAKPKTCTWCRPGETDIEPKLADRTPETARQPNVVRGDRRAAGPVGDDRVERAPDPSGWNDPDGVESDVAPRRVPPAWRDSPVYTPPPAAAFYPAPRFGRFRRWYRPGWRRFGRPVGRRWRYRRWRRRY